MLAMVIDSCSIFTIALALLGVLTLAVICFDPIWTLVQLTGALLSPYLIPNYERSLSKRYGPWALITGCTDGIGKAYAKELAKRGLNLVLVSRTPSKLEATSKEIEKEFAVKTKVIAADFTKGPAAIDHIKEELGKLEIGILVNNVGTQYTYPMYLGEVPDQELWDIINVNIGAVTLLSKMFVEEMKSRGRGAIVNVSSGSELQPLPLFTAYAASKAYVKNFTEALRYEYSRHGVTVQHLSPMFVNTKMNQFSSTLRKTTIFVPDAETFAKYAASTLGKLEHSTGYWSHGIQYFFTSIPPVPIRMRIGAFMINQFRREYFHTQKKISSP